MLVAGRSRVAMLTEEGLKKLALEAGEAIAAKDWDTISAGSIELLESVKKSDVVELKSLHKPPQPVIEIASAAMITLGHKDTSWQEIKKALLSSSFLKPFKEFDPSTIDDAMLKKLKPYAENEELAPDKAGKYSKACVSMATWVRAVYEYGSQ